MMDGYSITVSNLEIVSRCNTRRVCILPADHKLQQNSVPPFVVEPSCIRLAIVTVEVTFDTNNTFEPSRSNNAIPILHC